MLLKYIKYLFFLLICFCYVSGSATAQKANATARAGLILTAAFDSISSEGVELAIWYPAIKPESKLNLGDWKISAAKDSKEAAGKFPLIIISHDAGANKMSYSDIAADLARQGYVVAVPTHSMDNTNNMEGIFTAKEVFGRARELKVIIELLRGEPYSNFINTDKISIIGVGTGASTALILAGGTVDISSYANYCTSNPKSVYCSPWARSRLATLSFYLPQASDLKEAHISALVLVAPGYSMLFTKESLKKVTAPILLFKTEKTPYQEAESLRNILPQAPEFVLLKNMSSESITNLCQPEQMQTPTWQCRTKDEADNQNAIASFKENLLNFLSSKLE